ncbi:MAG: serine/threonine-protein kinase [Planctomycetota bacterium]
METPSRNPLDDPATAPPPTLPPDLERQLASLLELSADQQSSALERLLRDHAAHADQLRALFLLGRPGARRSLPMPERIGPYRLRHSLGEGGMGTVYLAEQEQPIRRTVALKLLRPGLVSDEAMARFAAERQTLALLDHPNIARVLDSGTTADGRPFFAMDYVPGEPLTAYSDRLDLGLPERLRLFVDVCRGVHHAHLRGIIHRDLKPSNVLVQEHDGRASPKIIDFGIAKATDHKLTDATLHTELGRIVGTPEYMSPEQADPGTAVIDVRSDVYSLGIVLYELLTGTLPLASAELRALPLPAMVQRIRESVPPRPSARATTLRPGPRPATDTREWTRRMRGDLDWVTLKALEKDPERRYQSAAALADDLIRYLEMRPVEAGPPSALYRLRRFCRRHRVPVTAAAAVLLSTIGGAAGMGWFALRSQRLAVEAQRHANQAEDLASFMMFDLRDRLRPLGRLDLLEAVAGKAKAYYDARTEAEAATTPDRGRAAALRNLAEVMQAQGRWTDALDLQQRARQIVEATGGGSLALSTSDVALASLHQDRGELDLAVASAARAVDAARSAKSDAGGDFAVAAAYESRARALRAAGDLRSARADWLASIAAYERAGSEHEDRLITALLGLAELDGAQGNTDAARAGHTRARALIDARLQEDPGNGRLLFLAAHVATRDGAALAAAGDSHAAVLALTGAEHALANLVERDPGNQDWRAELAMVRGRLGESLLDDGDSERAEQMFHAAVGLGRSLVEQRPDNAAWRARLGGCLFHLAVTVRQRGDASAARGLMGEAEHHASVLVTKDARQAEWQRLLGVSRYELGRLAESPGEALAFYERAATVQEELANRDPTSVVWHSDLASSRLGVGSAASQCGELGRATAAFAAARSSLQRLSELQPDELRWQRSLAACDQLAARAAYRTGDVQGALSLYRAAIPIRREVAARAPTNPTLRKELAVALLTLSDVLVDAGSTAEAVAAADEAVGILGENCARDPDNAAWTNLLGQGYSRLGCAHEANGDTTAMLAAFTRALEVSEDLLARDPHNTDWQRLVASSAHRIADANLEAGRDEPALRGYLRADELFRARAAARPDDLVAACDVTVNDGRLASALERLGRPAEARERFVRAAESGARLAGSVPGVGPDNVAFFCLAAARCGLRSGRDRAWIAARVAEGEGWFAKRDTSLAPEPELDVLLRGLRTWLSADPPESPADRAALDALLHHLRRPPSVADR